MLGTKDVKMKKHPRSSQSSRGERSTNECGHLSSELEDEHQAVRSDVAGQRSWKMCRSLLFGLGLQRTACVRTKVGEIVMSLKNS